MKLPQFHHFSIEKLTFLIMEGMHCLQTNCDTSNFELPVFEYGRDDGYAITGGYVYRGSSIPELYGKYIFADYGSGKVWSLNESDPLSQNKLLFEESLFFSSFGEDEFGELYVTSLLGKIFIFDLIEI